MTKRVDDFRLKLGTKELLPIMTGGMGVDISTAELSLVSARLGGIGQDDIVKKQPGAAAGGVSDARRRRRDVDVGDDGGVLRRHLQLVLRLAPGPGSERWHRHQERGEGDEHDPSSVWRGAAEANDSS